MLGRCTHSAGLGAERSRPSCRAVPGTGEFGGAREVGQALDRSLFLCKVSCPPCFVTPSHPMGAARCLICGGRCRRSPTVGGRRALATLSECGTPAGPPHSAPRAELGLTELPRGQT